MGTVDSSKSVETLQDYYALLFPTKFYTEGLPGTIIDAYASGIPVISSRWENFSDIIDEGVTGVGYEFGSYDALKEKLEKVAETPNTLLSMRESCIKKASDYRGDSLIHMTAEKLGGVQTI